MTLRLTDPSFKISTSGNQPVDSKNSRQLNQADKSGKNHHLASPVQQVDSMALIPENDFPASNFEEKLAMETAGNPGLKQWVNNKNHQKDALEKETVHAVKKPGYHSSKKPIASRPQVLDGKQQQQQQEEDEESEDEEDMDDESKSIETIFQGLPFQLPPSTRALDHLAQIGRNEIKNIPVAMAPFDLEMLKLPNETDVPISKQVPPPHFPQKPTRFANYLQQQHDRMSRYLAVRANARKPLKRINGIRYPQCWGEPSKVPTCDSDYEWKPIPDELFVPGTKIDGSWWPDFNAPEREKVRVLYLTRREDYLHRSYRFLYDEVEIASTHPQLDVRMWGPGFYGYNESQPLDVNIARVFGADDYFQVIYAVAFGVIEGEFKHSVLIQTIGDCHDMRCLDELSPNIDAMALRYSFEAMDLFRPEQMAWYTKYMNKDWKPLIFHHPECSLTKYFYPTTPATPNEAWDASRPFDVKLFGQTRYPFYALRKKVETGMKEGTIRGEPMKITPWWQDAKEDSPPKEESPNTLGKYIFNDPRTAHLQQTSKDWGEGMRKTKICVFDSSAERKTIRKFNEAMMSGCVVASDIPTEMEEAVFKDVVIRLDSSMTAQEIDAVLEDALKDPDNLKAMAVEAFKRARFHFSCRAKVDRLLEAAARFMRGERGYWFPYGYSATCRSYSTHSEYEQVDHPSWCRASDLYM